MIMESGHAKSAVIVIHEIYGVNQHMKNFCQSLREFEFDVFCPNLTVREIAFDYSQEGVAYQNFMENLGIPTALAQIKRLISDIKDNYQHVFVVGFSVGATVSWLCSEVNEVHGIVSYYGSRIRDYTGITHKCPALLFFPKKEQSFNVDELITILDKGNAKIHKFNGQHGFSDPFSPKYCAQSANNAFNKMVTFLLQQSLT